MNENINELQQNIYELFKEFCLKISIDELAGNSEVINNVETVERQLISIINSSSQGI